MEQILLTHAKKYPLMTPVDAVKLLYQSEFGGGHLIADEAACLEFVRRETDALPPTALPDPPEEIGGGLVRMDLGYARSLGISPETVGRMFIRSAQKRGDPSAFREKIDTLKALAEQNLLPFSSAELHAYLDGYDGGMVSHSSQYRQAYAPAYRIIDSRYVRLLPLIAAAEQAVREHGRAVIAIDGRCASGKTTAADLLSRALCAPVVHMDDFFLPPALRSPERYAAPGGNVHHERFAQEVLPHLLAGEAFTYRRFDCSVMDFGEAIEIPSASITIVEGAYSLHPAFGNYARLPVFSHIEPALQLERIFARDGDYVKVFREKWIPLEEKYLSACAVEERCAFRLD